MEAISPWIALYKEIAAVGFPLAMFLVIVSSYFDVWMWTKTHLKIVGVYDVRLKEWQDRCAKEEDEADNYQNMLLRSTGLLETTVTKIPTRG